MKSSSKLICLPRLANASKCFAVFKVLLILIFVTYTIYIAFWTWFTMSTFKQKIAEDATVHKVAINKTHRHFFLFTGLFIGSTVLIGLWGILREYIPVVFGFVIMLGFGFVFEAVGAYKSGSREVVELKAYTALPELGLMLFALIFCLMIRQSEKQLANLPIYRQTMAESRRESLAIQDDDGVDNPAMINDEEANVHGGKPYLEIPGISGRS